MVAIIHDGFNKSKGLENAFYRVTDEIREVTTIIECQDYLRHIADIYNLKNIAYLAINTPKIAEDEPYIITTYRREWIERYRRNDYKVIDPVLQQGFSSIMPLNWKKFPRSNAKLISFFGESTEFHVGRQGLTFPIRGRFGEAALLSITSDDSDAAWDSNISLFMRDFQVLAYHIHQTILKINGINISPPKLSPREIECLKWISRGKTVSEVAIILSLSDRTVRCYLDTARTKLNTTNVTHTVVRALQLNILTTVL